MWWSAISWSVKADWLVCCDKWDVIVKIQWQRQRVVFVIYINSRYQMLGHTFRTSHCQCLWFILFLFTFKYASECHLIGWHSNHINCRSNNSSSGDGGGGSNINNKTQWQQQWKKSKKNIINGNIVPKCDNERAMSKSTISFLMRVLAGVFNWTWTLMKSCAHQVTHLHRQKIRTENWLGNKRLTR